MFPAKKGVCAYPGRLRSRRRSNVLHLCNSAARCIPEQHLRLFHPPSNARIRTHDARASGDGASPSFTLVRYAAILLVTQHTSAGSPYDITLCSINTSVISRRTPPRSRSVRVLAVEGRELTALGDTLRERERHDA